MPSTAMLHSGVEYWVTVDGEEPPPDRALTAD
jgi:hypothetical protein